MVRQYEQALEAIRRIRDGGITNTATVEIIFHDASPELTQNIVSGFPDLTWGANQSGAHEWVQAKGDGFEITIFLEADPPKITDSLSQRILQRAGAL